ncbi:MAG: HAMP domain-containing histidine kinase [Candidatus Omnitrophica bacterium]|nr:HAMP domain-containing histidine kinase [Candidatus Omnitrophota bacterium]
MRKTNKKQEEKNIYKIVTAELKCNPLRWIKNCFALMAIIPFLVIFYLLIGKYSFYQIFLSSDGLMVAIAILISILGFISAYNLISSMVERMLSYFMERNLANEEKLKIISGLTHDLKTPLATIRASLQNMADGIAGSISKTQQQIAEICIKSLDKATNFINQMLELAKLKITILSFRRELVEFDQLVKEEVNEITTLAEKNNQKVSYKILATDPKIWADKEKLSRAVMNLLSNAVKYADKDGRIDVLLHSDNNTVRFAVINTGPGIPQDKINGIFIKKERLNLDSKIEGTGLGLSLVKDIIDLHKGHITVKSIPNKETEFNISLPRDLRVKARV